MSPVSSSDDRLQRGECSQWRLYLAVTLVVLVAEGIGKKRIAVGPGSILMLPMLYAMVLGVLLHPRWVRFLKPADLSRVSSLTTLGIGLLAARIGTSLGPNVALLWHLSLPLILQKLGQFLGTVVLSLPVAVLLGLGREAVGACFSLAREGGLALIGEKYGFDSPEGRGVLSQYFFGTLLGAIWLGLMAGWVDSLALFDPASLALACGVGSISMMAASASTLAAAHPGMQEQITALAGAANLVTMLTGLYFSVFISLPLTSALYNRLTRAKGGCDAENA